MGRGDDLGAWNPYHDLTRYTKDDASETSIDDDESGEIATRERDTDARVP
jgi:hypothetical protein